MTKKVIKKVKKARQTVAAKAKQRTPRSKSDSVVCARTFYVASSGEVVKHIEVTSKDTKVSVAKRGCGIDPRVRLATVQFLAEIGDACIAVADHLNQNGTITVYYRK